MLRKKRRQNRKPYDWGLPDNTFTWLMREFVDASKAKGFSERTAHYRYRAMRRFILWCEARGLAHPREVTLPIIERYQRHLYHYRKANGQPLSFSSQRAEVVPLKAFFQWATRSHHILYNPAADIELPRQAMRIPRHVFTIAEVETILNQADAGTPQGLRDRAILETFYSTGIRRSELVNLNEQDIDIERGTLIVIEGKGRKDRMVPLGARACAWLARYRDQVRPELVCARDDGALFLTDYGERFPRNVLGDLVKRYIVQAGFGVPGSCHLFRHAMATHMLENGADIRYIQAMLGHANLNTTQIYTQVSIQKLKQIHAATHPARLERAGGDNAKTRKEDAGGVREALLAALDAEAMEEV
jgi:integrase/recombinase XerD